MKQLFTVAQNAFTVSTPDGGITAWQSLDDHYRPFEQPESVAQPVIEIGITVGRLPICAAETIYEPKFGGIGFISSRALRLHDGSLVMEFRHISGRMPRLWMKMSCGLDRADIILAPDGDSDDAYFVTHAVMIAFMLATCGNGTLLMHSSAVLHDGKAYLFQGKSGTGKSTHATLWTRHIAGAELLNDDHPVVRFAPDGTAMAYGSPWSGKTDCYRDVSAPLGAFVRIVRAGENSLRRLAPLQAYASLTSSVFYLPFLSEELRETRHKTIERLVGAVPCCEMHCRPDADAARTCSHALTTRR